MCNEKISYIYCDGFNFCILPLYNSLHELIECILMLSCADRFDVLKLYIYGFIIKVEFRKIMNSYKEIPNFYFFIHYIIQIFNDTTSLFHMVLYTSIKCNHENETDIEYHKLKLFLLFEIHA